MESTQNLKLEVIEPPFPTSGDDLDDSPRGHVPDFAFAEPPSEPLRYEVFEVEGSPPGAFGS